MTQKKMSPAVSHKEDLDRRLKNSKFAAEFLKASFLDFEGDDHSSFLLALQDVIRAHGLASVAKGAGVSRDALYKAMRKGGNPTVATLVAVLRELDLQLTIEPLKRKQG